MACIKGRVSKDTYEIIQYWLSHKDCNTSEVAKYLAKKYNKKIERIYYIKAKYINKPNKDVLTYTSHAEERKKECEKLIKMLNEMEESEHKKYINKLNNIQKDRPKFIFDDSKLSADY